MIAIYIIIYLLGCVLSYAHFNHNIWYFTTTKLKAHSDNQAKSIWHAEDWSGILIVLILLSWAGIIPSIMSTDDTKHKFKFRFKNWK